MRSYWLRRARQNRSPVETARLDTASTEFFALGRQSPPYALGWLWAPRWLVAEAMRELCQPSNAVTFVPNVAEHHMCVHGALWMFLVENCRMQYSMQPEARGAVCVRTGLLPGLPDALVQSGAYRSYCAGLRHVCFMRGVDHVYAYTLPASAMQSLTTRYQCEDIAAWVAKHMQK